MEIENLEIDLDVCNMCPTCESTDIFNVTGTKKVCNKCMKTFDVVQNNAKQVMAFDMDGTLTPSRRPISKEMLKELHRLNKSYKLVIVTGGSLELVKRQLLDHITFPIILYIYTTSGTQMYLYNNHTTMKVYKVEMTWDLKGYIFSILKQMITELDLKPETSLNDMVDDRGSQITFSAIGRNAKPETKDAYDKDTKKRQKLVAWIEENHKDLLEYAKVYIGGTTSIDFLHKNVNKAVALEMFSKSQKIELDKFIYFGDQLQKGGNDYVVTKVCNTVAVTDDKDLLEKVKKYGTQ